MQNPDIFTVVNMVINLIALTITPLFLAMISKTKPGQVAKKTTTIIIVTLSIFFGVTATVLLALLALKAVRMWQDM